MADTPSTTRSKTSKTPKRSRHSPPEAPTPKPLQKLSKTDKLDNLILNFLKHHPKRKENQEEGKVVQEEDQEDHIVNKSLIHLKFRRKRL